MNTTRSKTRAPSRGFIFLLVLMVMVVGVIVIGVALGRSATQSALAQSRYDEYKRHHEVFGIRDIVLEWVQRPGIREKMLDYSRQRLPAYDIVLPSGDTISLSVRDGQGTVKTALTGAMNAESNFYFHDIVARLPPDRPDLERRVGPMTISLFGAPDEVLRAVGENNDQLTQLLIAMRDEPSMDAAKFTNALQATGFADKTSVLSQVLTFAPSLYEIRARVNDSKAVRRYRLLVQMDGNMPSIKHTTIVPGDGTAELEEELQSAGDTTPTRGPSGAARGADAKPGSPSPTDPKANTTSTTPAKAAGGKKSS